MQYLFIIMAEFLFLTILSNCIHVIAKRHKHTEKLTL